MGENIWNCFLSCPSLLDFLKRFKESGFFFNSVYIPYQKRYALADFYFLALISTQKWADYLYIHLEGNFVCLFLTP